MGTNLISFKRVLEKKYLGGIMNELAGISDEELHLDS